LNVKTKIEPSDGFRLLNDGEHVQASDEWHDAASNTWKPFRWANPMKIHRAAVDAPVRRKEKAEGGNLKPESRTVGPRPSDLGARPSALGPRPSDLGPRE
jgi:hypothetical protein